MEMREVFARNLRKARNARGLSQEALAHEAGIDRTYVSALERSEYSATIDMVAKLANSLGDSRPVAEVFFQAAPNSVVPAKTR